MSKSTLQEIESRFDNDVERFSNLETGQLTTLDASFNMQLMVDGIVKCYPRLGSVLDIGCGAGNYGVKLLQSVSPVAMTLVDLSMPMLSKAKERIEAVNIGGLTTCVQGDFRTVELPQQKFDVIIATAVLHHLRDEQDWKDSFGRLYDLLAIGGSIWIFDLVEQAVPALQDVVYKERYGAYLTSLKDEAYRDHVFAYIEKEDSPRSLVYQLDMLKEVGFSQVDILHKNLCFASFVAFK